MKLVVNNDKKAGKSNKELLLEVIEVLKKEVEDGTVIAFAGASLRKDGGTSVYQQGSCSIYELFGALGRYYQQFWELQDLSNEEEGA